MIHEWTYRRSDASSHSFFPVPSTDIMNPFISTIKARMPSPASTLDCRLHASHCKVDLQTRLIVVEENAVGYILGLGASAVLLVSRKQRCKPYSFNV